MRLFVCSALIMLLTSPFVLAEKVVLGMSQDEVAITATFDGSNILVFGAIQRDAPIPETPIDVIVTVSGPSEPLDVRRKAKRFGIWVNTDTVQVDAAPSFYAIATSAPLGDILTETEDLRHKVSINRAIRSVGAPMNILDAQSFTDAVIRIREANGLYTLQEGSVSIAIDTEPSCNVYRPLASRIRITASVKLCASRIFIGAPTERMARLMDTLCRRSSVSVKISPKGALVAIA